MWVLHEVKNKINTKNKCIVKKTFFFFKKNKINTKIKCIVKKSFFSKNVIRESRATKYALTNYDTAWICHCWKNGRYFYKMHLATLTIPQPNVQVGVTHPTKYTLPNSWVLLLLHVCLSCTYYVASKLSKVNIGRQMKCIIYPSCLLHPTMKPLASVLEPIMLRLCMHCKNFYVFVMLLLCIQYNN